MKIFYLISLIVIIFSGCENHKKETILNKKLNHNLINKLSTMKVNDQIAAKGKPPKKLEYLTRIEWNEYKDSTFISNQIELEKIHSEYGFPGFDLVGKDGSFNFWLMTQHCDHKPEFQKMILNEMKNEMEKGNASKRNYAYLNDRVRKNAGEKLIYGTQVKYNKFGQAYPATSLIDSINVDIRRKEVELEPLIEYLNRLTTAHFEMNKENFIKRGIKKPNLYNTQ